MNRFDGKPLINHVQLDGIRKTEELVIWNFQGNAEIYKAANGGGAAESSSEKLSLGSFLQHLMSSV